MLVIARKRDQRIKIGDNVELVIVSVRDGVVRIGIDAPRDVKITRVTEAENAEQTEKACRN